eukprot:2541475-Rhodomonas_salina.1
MGSGRESGGPWCGLGRRSCAVLEVQQDASKCRRSPEICPCVHVEGTCGFIGHAWVGHSVRCNAPRGSADQRAQAAAVGEPRGGEGAWSAFGGA